MAWSLFWPKATGLPAPNTHHGKKKITGMAPELDRNPSADSYSECQPSRSLWHLLLPHVVLPPEGA